MFSMSRPVRCGGDQPGCAMTASGISARFMWDLVPPLSNKELRLRYSSNDLDATVLSSSIAFRWRIASNKLLVLT